ncbi:MAG: Zn-ribbon domain-containing OB-fold protein [Candidatus Binataceae bacterium]|jgi:uncharacterized OB-fold protein
MTPFLEGASQSRLMIVRCSECGTTSFPAREFCSNCLSSRSGWIQASGRGEVYSFNVMHQVYHPGFAADVPYAVVVVKLEEGPKMVANLIGVKPHEIRCGIPVEVTFGTIGGVTLPQFRLRPVQ